MVQLFDVLSSGNRHADERKKLSSQGYKIDKSLSNHNNQVYYNDKKKDLIYNVRGTHNLSDWGTNLSLAAGRIKSTKRYMDAHKGLRQAKAKYKIDGVTVTGESLGGQIASLIHSKNDKAFTFNKASTIGQTERPTENSFRVAGDAISTFSNAKTFKNPHVI